MRKHVLCCVVVLLTAPAFATITKQQAAATWNQTNTTTCVVPFGMNTTLNNLIVVWTSWQTASGTSNTLTASVQDSPSSNSYVSAVGPTLQSAASNPTAAQIFYAKKIAGGSDTVNVTYSGTVHSASCVIVEYSGADQSNPLDSAHAGYSYSTGNLWDSGTVPPTNANLLLFGAGTSDNGAATTALPWTTIQSNGGSITEYQVVSGNTSLQRANANTGMVNGNWVMQMAVFRDASLGPSVGSRVSTDASSSLVNGSTGANYLPYNTTNAVVGGVVVPPGAPIKSSSAGFFIATSSCDSMVRTTCAAVGVTAFGATYADKAAAWGMNSSVADVSGTSNTQLNGIQNDIGVSGTPLYVRGITTPLNPAAGGVGTMPSDSIGYELGGYDDLAGHTLKWSAGFLTDSGAVGSGGRGLELGATSKTGTSVDSQWIALDRFDSWAHFQTDKVIKETSTAVLTLAPPSGAVRNLPVTFGTLPACSAGTEGASAAVTDLLAANCGDGTCNTWGTTVTGGTGAIHRQLYCDGTNWTLAAK